MVFLDQSDGGEWQQHPWPPMGGRVGGLQWAVVTLVFDGTGPWSHVLICDLVFYEC